MPGLYTHTTRATGTILTATIYNGDHQNHIDNQTPQMTDDYSANVAQMQAETSPGGVGSESIPIALSGELERVRYTLRSIHGGGHWYDVVRGTLGTGLVPIIGGSISAAASQTFYALSNAYRAFILILTRIDASMDATNLRFRFAKGTTPVTAAQYYLQGMTVSAAVGVGHSQDTGATYAEILSSLGNDIGENAMGIVFIQLPRNTTEVPLGISLGLAHDSASALRFMPRGFMLDEGTPTAEVDGFDIIVSSGTFSGQYMLFGVR